MRAHSHGAGRRLNQLFKLAHPARHTLPYQIRMLDSFSRSLYSGQAQSMPLPQRIAVISVHSCPLARPGTRDAGGMNIYIRETARVMASLGIEVDIFTREHLDEDEHLVDWPARCRVIHLTAGPAEAVRTDLPAWLDAFAAEIIAHNRRASRSYEAIISHYWLSGLVAQRLRRHWDAPHVAGFHTLSLAKPPAYQDEADRPQREVGERSVVTRVDALLAATDHEQELLTWRYGADAGRIFMAPPGVDTEQFKPLNRDRCSREIGLPETRFRLLFAGRTTPIKGIPLLIEALALLPEDASAVVVGGSPGDPTRRSLREVTQHFGVAGRVRFVGSVPHEQLPTYFGAADLCVVPSYYESYGMVALEALACGRPVVASRVGGLESVIDHGVNGILVPPGSAHALSDAIDALRRDRRNRESLGAAGIKKARRCTWERTTHSILGALAEQNEIENPANHPPVVASTV